MNRHGEWILADGTVYEDWRFRIGYLLSRIYGKIIEKADLDEIEAIIQKFCSPEELQKCKDRRKIWEQSEGLRAEEARRWYHTEVIFTTEEEAVDEDAMDEDE